MIQRGQVYFGTLGDHADGIQSGNRPLLVLQNNTGNKYSKTILVAPITSQRKKEMPTHFNITLNKKSTVLCEQITVVQKSQLGSLLYTLNDKEIELLDKALIASLGIKCGGNRDG